MVMASAGCRFNLPELINCTTDDQCIGRAGGRCELATGGFCSYADSECMSGQRYDDYAGKNSGRCVGDEQTGGDGGIDGPAPRVCYGSTSGLVRPCFPSALTGDITLPAAIDTTNAPTCSTTVTDVPTGLCVIAGANITVASGTVAATGTKSLVLVATGTIAISGVLDASSRHATTAPYATIQVGAGADPMNGCNTPGASMASGGGAGGTFTELGGAGGSGTAGGIGGTAASPQSTLTLRGGCRGQNALGAGGGRGGRGGGSVYLIASTITIDGTINASGEGGGLGVAGGNPGGGGGGSGGLIGFDAPIITNTGLVFANGGGGGEGAGGGASGLPGGDPTGTATATGGIGGSAGGNGGNGGAGGTSGGTKMGGNGTTATNDGGGGGGGGTGVIKVYGGGTLGGQYSPPP